MPKRAYTPEEKKLVRRLLLIHQGDVNTVRHLTGFPERTIYQWRTEWEDDYDLYAAAFAENAPAAAIAIPTPQAPSNAVTAGDSAVAETQDSFAEYAQLRQKLMEHTTTLTDGLLRGDGMVHQRVQAISRLLDRVLALDEFLPSQQPQQSVENLPPNRIEFVYDDAIHAVPPWHDADTLEGSLRYNEKYFDTMKEQSRQRIIKSFAEESVQERANDPEEPDWENSDSVSPDLNNQDPFSLF